jgi:flagellar motor switch protein FliG
VSLETNNLTKAAVVLMSLGKDLAAEVMKYLTETEVKKLSRAFMSVHEVGRESQRDIANEFSNMLMASDTMVVDGSEFARDVIGSAFGSDAGDSLLEYITGSRKESLSTLIGDIPSNIIDNFIQSEHPQTIAFLMTKMTPDMAAELLGKMDEELQTDVLVRVAQLEHVKTDVVDEVREVLRSQLRGVSMGEDEEVGGAKTTADILNFVERNNEERILAEIEDSFPELADEIRNLMFTFEDINKIDDKSIQTILKEAPRDQLVLALKTASPELRDLLFRNISQRAAEMIQDDLDTLGPTPLKEVEKAQQAIIDIVRRLEAEGKITIAAGGDDVLV